jgi:hypothetical protein
MPCAANAAAQAYQAARSTAASAQQQLRVGQKGTLEPVGALALLDRKPEALFAE